MNRYRKEHFKNAMKGMKIAIITLGIIGLAIVGILFGKNKRLSGMVQAEIEKLILEEEELIV